MGIDPDKVANPRFRQLLAQAEAKPVPEPEPAPPAPKAKRARPQTKESDVHDLIVAFCDRNEIWPEHSNPSEPTTNRPGSPDFFCMKAGRVVGLEIKVGYNNLSGSQRRTFPQINRCGVDIYLCCEKTEGQAYIEARTILIKFFNLTNPV